MAVNLDNLKPAVSYKHKLDRLAWNEHLTPAEEEEWAVAMFNEYNDPDNTMYVSETPMSYEDCVKEVEGEVEWSSALHFMQSDD